MEEIRLNTTTTRFLEANGKMQPVKDSKDVVGLRCVGRPAGRHRAGT
jgi:hypothetical protein